MMLPIMLYTLLMACLLGAAALVTERIAARTGGPRRGIWLASLVASVVLPAAAILTGNATDVATPPPAETASPRETAPGAQPSDASDTVGVSLTLPDWRRSSLFMEWMTAAGLERRAFDRPLAILWIASSAAVVLVYGLGWLALRRARRNWRPARLEGDDVLVSDRLGPAMFGFVDPGIVVPRWVLGAPSELRSLVLRHEREHIASRDHHLLGAALALAALVPWNPALWWQLKRLRMAIEIDCDARVVRGGADAVTYSKVLLAVRQHRVVTPLAAVALTEPVSQLERRIGILLRAPSRPSRWITAGGSLVAMSLIATACVVSPPEARAPDATEAAAGLPAAQRQPITGMEVAGDRTVVLVDTSATMLDRTQAGVARRQQLSPAEQRQAPKWQQLSEIVEGLAAEIPAGARFQVIAYSDQAHSLAAGSDSQWLVNAEQTRIDDAIRALRDDVVPQGGSNLYAALTAAAALEPPPETLYLVTDGLPTAGPTGRRADEDDLSFRRFDAAIGLLPAGTRVNPILLPKDDDVSSAPSYWTLALRTGGSLLAPAEDASDGANLGIALDSRYLVFVVDTSGSMHQFAWDHLREHIEATIDAYPSVKGIQFLSDEGEYLLQPSTNAWIPNAPPEKDSALGALAGWTAFSNSTPREGLLTAIDSLEDVDGGVAIYVYGDDFASGSPAAMLNEVTSRNRFDTGERKARIHTVALPVYYEVTGELLSAANYAAVMRVLSQRNGGSFIALPED